MKFLVLALLGLWIVGCAPEKKARFTLEEYRADAELRHSELDRCAKDPGSLRSDPDCLNAHAASAFEDRVSLRDAPPIGLKKSSEKPSKPLDPRLGE